MPEITAQTGENVTVIQWRGPTCYVCGRGVPVAQFPLIAGGMGPIMICADDLTAGLAAINALPADAPQAAA